MKILPSKQVVFNLISVSLLTSITLGAIVLVLKNPLNVLNAQTNPTSYWNVERDGSNNLNFSFTNNSAAGVVGLQLLQDGTINAAGGVNVGGIVSTNSQITAKQGLTTGFANLNSGMTGQRPYQFGYQEGGAWTSPYPDLILGYHTGVKIGGNTNYGGTKIYSDHPSMTGALQLFSVGDGDGHVRVANNLVFPNPGSGISAPAAGGSSATSFYQNDGSHGAWKIKGTRGGWGGLEFESPYSTTQTLSLMVGHSTHNNANVYTGMHLNNVGWLWYASGKDMYAESFRDSGNGGYYLDPAGASNLNGATFASGPTTNDWFRANGNNGLYFQAHNGGWHMIDSTYVRSYSNKAVLAPSYYDQDNAGYYLDPASVSNLNYVYTANGSHFPFAGNNWNYIRGNSYIAGDTGVILSNGNVGIGTTAPQGKLGVGFGNGDQVIFLQINDDGLGIQTTLNGQPNNGYGGHTNNRLTLQPTTGVVGIHTPYPNADFHIKQSDNSQGGTGGIKLERSDTGGFARIFEGGDQQLYLFTNSNSHYCLVSISGSIPCASDRRLKDNIEPLTSSGLEIISKLKPTTYNWKASGERSAGFIAQDVEEVLPEAVTKSEETGYFALSDAYFTPFLVKGVQELDQKTNKTDAEVKTLTEQVTNQQSEIELLKKEVAEIKKLLNDQK